MKIEIGENLFYSWLRHVKDCQIVQTNWKTSSQWSLQHHDEILSLLQKSDEHFESKYQFHIFKQNASLSQILQQAECDVVGISLQEGSLRFYAIDVAFHEAGLNYGSHDATVIKVVAKLLRTAMCMLGYMNCKDAELIFASPKINPAILNNLIPCIEDINAIFHNCNLNFKARIIANHDFHSTVLQPILIASQGIADTSELFIRSYQMFSMFSLPDSPALSAPVIHSNHTSANIPVSSAIEEKLKELKIGKIANIEMRRILEHGFVSEEEIEKMQQSDYSKTTFDLQYPVLAKADSVFERVRYYTQPLYIRGIAYYLCSQWFESAANNDRPYLLKWLSSHE